MRNLLWTGQPATEAEEELKRLCKEQADLSVQVSRQVAKLDMRRQGLRKAINAEKGPTLARAKAERELRGVEAQIKAAEEKRGDARRKTAEAWKVLRDSSQRGPGVYVWQERAVSLIELHQYFHKKEPGSVIPTTLGSTITTEELQRQLRAEGFEVGARELRRFMRTCRVEPRQGKRSDLSNFGH
jgi:hypothetical protein